MGSEMCIRDRGKTRSPGNFKLSKSLFSTNFAISQSQFLASQYGSQLNFKMQRQELDYWCWAAVGASVAEFTHQREIQQCELASRCLGLTSCCSTPSSCDEPWYLEYALEITGSLRFDKEGSVGLGEVQAQIDSGIPVCARLEYGANVGHFVAITGYHGDVLTIRDPLRTVRKMRYYEFATNYLGSAYWNWTYFCL